MSIETNKATTRRFFDEIINGGNLDLAGIGMLRGAISGLRFNEEDLIAEGDTVVARLTMAGTHTGEFMGVPPTNRSVEIQVIDIMEFRDGKVTAHWGSMDQAAMMEQLGLAPEM